MLYNMKKQVFVFILWLFCLFNTYSEESDFLKTLSTVSSMTHKKVYDIDCNNKINCIDYAVIYKSLWDSNCAPGHTMNCEIVRNKNPENGFHHLFIRVRSDYQSQWYYIEPQAKYPNIDMVKYWGTRYNFMYNIYGETYVWVRFL